MTLQYRIRSKSEDQDWAERLSLCRELIVYSSDKWLRGDVSDFSSPLLVSQVLYLFSTRCRLHETNLSVILNGDKTDPLKESEKSWPSRTSEEGQLLVDALFSVLQNASALWEAKGFGVLSVSEVVKSIEGVMVDMRYVVFHHYQTTKRDINHWGI